MIRNRPVAVSDAVPREKGASQHCIRCRESMPPGSRFCPACGQSSRAPEKRPGISDKIHAESSASLLPTDQAADEPLPAEELPALPKTPAPLPSNEAADKCDCGARPVADALFCHRCGKSFQGPAHGIHVHWSSPNGDRQSYGPIDGDVVIGTDDACELVLKDDQFISRRHARLSKSDGFLYVEDLASSNGTFVRICRPLLLEAGDEVIVGQCRLQIRLTESPKP